MSSLTSVVTASVVTVVATTVVALTVVEPCSTSMGSEPGGVFSSSRARPGQRKPEEGHSSGSGLPVGAQKPGPTPTHASALAAPVALRWVPPSHGRAALEPLGQ